MPCGGILKGEQKSLEGKSMSELMGISSGGVYVYYWPRGGPNIPDDVKVSNAILIYVSPPSPFTRQIKSSNSLPLPISWSLTPHNRAPTPSCLIC